MRLAQLQAAYRAYLVSGDAAPLAPAIVPDSFDAAERLAIYRNNFLISLTEALKANFPVTLQLLGGDFFEQAARRFVVAQPPQQPCLFEYGAGFDRFLHDLPQLASMSYVAEMARFEFARIAAYNAPEEPYLSASQLAACPPEQLDATAVRLARHAQIVAVQAPILQLWQAHQKPEPDLGAIEMSARPHHLLVSRPDRLLMAREIDEPTMRFLSATRTGATLGSAAAQSGLTDDAALGAIIALALELRLLTTPTP